MKWIPVVILVVIAGFFAFVAVEYFTVSIHALPSWIPGAKTAVVGHHHHPPRGHYRKRGAVAAIIAFILLAVAGWLTYRNTRSPQASEPAPANV
ncbi:MAG TPA: hypothetical protein VE991_15130 [Acidimicrobiales bacterium]|nr:hypothetical protein [Acidimicrobiales bacterium]